MQPSGPTPSRLKKTLLWAAALVAVLVAAAAAGAICARLAAAATLPPICRRTSTAPSSGVPATRPALSTTRTS